MRNFFSIKLLILCVLNYLPISLLGQGLNFEHLSTIDGLPATECYKVIQDKKGYIWVFTEYGIVKHNGERFIPVCTNILLKDQNAYAVFQTKEGELYFSNSFNKVFKIRNDSAFVIQAIADFTIDFTEPEDIVFQLILDEKKNIYFSCYKGSFCWDATTNKINTVSYPSENSADTLFYKPISDQFFSFRSEYFSKIESFVSIQEGNTAINFKIFPRNYYEIRTVEKIDDAYFLATSDLIYKTSKSGTSFTQKLDGIIDFKVDRNKQLWISTKNGLVLLDKNLTIIARYLQGKIVTNTCFDDKGGVWATTIGEGVYYCRNKDEVVYSNNDLKQNEVYFIKKEGSKLFLSTIDGNCYNLSAGKNTDIELIQHFDNKLFCGDFSEYRDGYIFSTKNGIFLKSKNAPAIELEGPLGLKGTYSNFVQTINDHEFLIFGGTSVHHFKNDSFYNSYQLKNKLYCVAYYDEDNFIIGTKNGIYLYNHKKNTATPFSDFFSNKFIMKLIFDHSGNLWVATRGDGLFILTKDKQLIKYTDLPFFVVKDIDFFNDSGVILSTNLGIYVNNYSGTTLQKEWINIFDSEVNALELVDNKLWIASRKGLYSMDFLLISKNDFYPILLNSVYSGTQRVLTNSSELKYNQNDLRFNFDFLNYQSKIKNFYFKLEGPTQLSGTITGTVLQIQNLEPGQYKLDIFPYHGPAYSKNHYLSQTFTIKPAFWQTVWFKLFLFLLIILISGFTVSLYYGIKRKRDKKHNEMQKLLAEYKLTALKAQINPHFISNSLAAIQLLIDSGKIDQANQYIAKFSLFIRYVLKYSDKSVSKLKDELKIIELNVELEQLRFVNSFKFSMQIAEDIDISEIYVPPLITQPFIENAIWHGLIPLKSENRFPELILKVEKHGDILCLSIIDNGVGRKKAANVHSLSNSGVKESVGTILIQNRIDNLNQMYDTTTAEVTIVDLVDSESNSTGTCVNIFLPISLLRKF